MNAEGAMGNGWLPKPTSDTDSQVSTPGKSLHGLLPPLGHFSGVQLCAGMQRSRRLCP